MNSIVWATNYGRPVRKSLSARPKIKSQSQIFRYGQSIIRLLHRPKFSDFFDLYLHWVFIVRGLGCLGSSVLYGKISDMMEILLSILLLGVIFMVSMAKKK